MNTLNSFKVIKVINSCNSLEQLASVENWIIKIQHTLNDGELLVVSTCFTNKVDSLTDETEAVQ